MNTANLQLEGLLMAIAAVNQSLVAKGVLATEEIDHALAICEQTARGDERLAVPLASSRRPAGRSESAAC